MPFSYNPKDASDTIPEAEYDAEIVKVEETQSKSSGSDMYVISFKIFGESRDITLKDYIVVPNALFKLKQLAQALGKLADFNAGTFDPNDYIGSALKAEVIIEQTDAHGDQNRIKKVKAASTPKVTAPPAAPTPAVARPASAVRERAKAAAMSTTSPIGNDEHFKDDDIPF